MLLVREIYVSRQEWGYQLERYISTDKNEVTSEVDLLAGPYTKYTLLQYCGKNPITQAKFTQAKISGHCPFSFKY
jgi:hypothetical protein